MAKRKRKAAPKKNGQGCLVLLCIIGAIIAWLITSRNDAPARLTAPTLRPASATVRPAASQTPRPAATQRPTATRRPAATAVPAQSYSCPSNCDGARAMGLSAQQAAACGLDRDGDGVACYGD